jgi:hypothetical protein
MALRLRIFPPEMDPHETAGQKDCGKIQPRRVIPLKVRERNWAKAKLE